MNLLSLAFIGYTRPQVVFNMNGFATKWLTTFYVAKQRNQKNESMFIQNGSVVVNIHINNVKI